METRQILVTIDNDHFDCAKQRGAVLELRRCVPG